MTPSDQRGSPWPRPLNGSNEPSSRTLLPSPFRWFNSSPEVIRRRVAYQGQPPLARLFPKFYLNLSNYEQQR
jgi:hypothetical protein